MKVYVVLQNDRNSEYNYCGVYLTEEQAQNRINEILKEFEIDKDTLFYQEEELE